MAVRIIIRISTTSSAGLKVGPISLTRPMEAEVAVLVGGTSAIVQAEAGCS